LLELAKVLRMVILRLGKIGRDLDAGNFEDARAELLAVRQILRLLETKTRNSHRGSK
jgi:hypothetical protein